MLPTAGPGFITVSPTDHSSGGDKIEDITIIKQRLNVQFKDYHLDGSGGGDSVSKQQLECYLLLFSELPKVLNTSSERTTELLPVCFFFSLLCFFSPVLDYDDNRSGDFR